MNTLLAILIGILAFCAGCAKGETRSVAGLNVDYHAERMQLKGQPIPVPAVTPYDGSQQLRAVFVSGFEKGWNVALEYWLGNAIIIPEEYQNSAANTEAWRNGWTAAQHALYERVRSMAGATPSR